METKLKACELELCLSNQRSQCALEEVGINAYGMCGACVLPAVDGPVPMAPAWAGRSPAGWPAASDTPCA